MGKQLKGGVYIIAIIFVVFTAISFFGNEAPPNDTLEEAGSEIATKDTMMRESVFVQRVIDGDTVDLADGERVRLIGIDTPERGEDGYEEARARLSELVLGKSVIFERDLTERDKYNRLLRYIFIDDILINEVMVREGFASQFPFGDDRKYQEQIASAEKSAKTQGLGIWKE